MNHLLNIEKGCNENICIICENDHSNHNIIDLVKIILNKNELIKGIEDLKLSLYVLTKGLSLKYLYL